MSNETASTGPVVVRVKDESLRDDIEKLETGCIRQKREGRGAYELLSPWILERDAKLYEWGAKNRAPRNWELCGCPFSHCIQSILRHMMAFMKGETDPDHGDPLAAVRFWAGAMMHYEEMIKRGVLPKSLDDRPRYDAPSGILQIYVAGPMTWGNTATDEQRDANCRRGVMVGKRLEDRGHHVFIPHRYNAPLTAEGYERIMGFDLSLIRDWATALYLIEASPGVDREVVLAKEKGIPIFRTVEEVPNVR